jgi:hypothetical protein
MQRRQNSDLPQPLAAAASWRAGCSEVSQQGDLTTSWRSQQVITFSSRNPHAGKAALSCTEKYFSHTYLVERLYFHQDTVHDVDLVLRLLTTRC